MKKLLKMGPNSLWIIPALAAFYTGKMLGYAKYYTGNLGWEKTSSTKNIGNLKEDSLNLYSN